MWRHGMTHALVAVSTLHRTASLGDAQKPEVSDAKHVRYHIGCMRSGVFTLQGSQLHAALW